MKRVKKVLLLLCCLLALAGTVTVQAKVVPGEVYFIHSVADKNFTWDLRGFHLYAERLGGKITLTEQDKAVGVYKAYEGADRFIKVIQHPSQTDYYFFQPQHSYLVADITGGSTSPGSELQLWDHGKANLAQMFKMEPVTGQEDTYYISNARSNLYLTAHGKGKNITQENFTGAAAQQWFFAKAPGSTMAPPSAEYLYAIENVKGRKFIDIPGAAPNQGRTNAQLQLWDMDSQPDRYVELLATDSSDYFYIHPLHSTEVWDVAAARTDNGTPVQLWWCTNTYNQQFAFEYAGEPLTYYIKERHSGKYLDAVANATDQNGCKIAIYSLYAPGQRANQTWRLHLYPKYLLPPQNQEFYIKSAYVDKYWDLGGTGAKTNEKGSKFKMWSFEDASDRKFKFLPSGDHVWVYLQVQNGGRHVDVKGATAESGANLHLWDAHRGDSQKFVLQFTSPTTVLLRTRYWKNADISGGTSDAWKNNGAELKQQDIHNHANQQFQLIYASGDKKMTPYTAEPIYLGPTEPVAFSGYIFFQKFDANLLVKQQRDLLTGQLTDYTYSFFQNSANTTILAVNSKGGSGTKILQSTENNGQVSIVVEEDSTVSEEVTFFVLETVNPNIIVKKADNTEYKQMSVNNDKWLELAKKYAPELRFSANEISFPSPVDGIINNAYKVKSLPKEYSMLAPGVEPELAINDAGTVLEIHRTSTKHLNEDGLSTNYNYQIHYRVGIMDYHGNVDFAGHQNLTTGENPSIALNNHNIVVEAHKHATDSGIDIRYGKINSKMVSIDFKNSGKQASGNHPSLAINDDGNFIMAYAADGGVKYLYGHVTQGEIKFYNKGVTLVTAGTRPSVALNNQGQLVLTYQYADNIYYVTGLYKNATVTFNNTTILTTGKNSNVTLNDAGHIMEIHETSNMHLRKNADGEAMLYTMVHYRYGALKVINGAVQPYIDFSNFVELSSGVTPDITMNNKGDVVQIHERPMRDDLGDFNGFSNLDEYLWDIVTNDDNGLRYRSVKGMTGPQLVTRLSDLPANESGYILVKKGSNSWEALNRNYKIYAVIGQNNDGNIEIEYNFFYPTNGTNVLGTELLNHVGDWEKIYVILDANSNFIGARYHYHSYNRTFSQNELEFADSTHPVVYVAEETHGSYPTVSFAEKECATDIVKPKTSWKSANNMEVVKIYGQILNGNEWIHWRGAWGSSLNSPSSKMWK